MGQSIKDAMLFTLHTSLLYSWEGVCASVQVVWLDNVVFCMCVCVRLWSVVLTAPAHVCGVCGGVSTCMRVW